MNSEYFAQCGDSSRCQILIEVGTKNREKGMQKADEMINDILSAIHFTKEHHDEIMKQDNPQFMKSLDRISKKLWKCLA